MHLSVPAQSFLSHGFFGFKRVQIRCEEVPTLRTHNGHGDFFFSIRQNLTLSTPRADEVAVKILLHDTVAPFFFYIVSKLHPLPYPKAMSATGGVLLRCLRQTA